MEVLEKIENSKAEKQKMKEEEEESSNQMEQGNKTVFNLSSRAKREKFLLNSYKKPQPKNSDGSRHEALQHSWICPSS